ncbi:hypothetical protein CWE13_08480 [Aliidiomarina shirensis]|uniref:Uncharacterized protein n=1 Tax=Aliidiomarina shirensis TaxID=1048642 RepID=A0A432WSX8_9GAMM|nr:hypothetical protein [Aliidiomarina shirensis]RUO36873.1 hypothetical protein CWE13_08480 [Aliidiomarina shirensis]
MRFLTYKWAWVFSIVLLLLAQPAQAMDGPLPHEQKPLTLDKGMYEGIETLTREYILLGIREDETHFILDFSISDGFQLRHSSYFTDDSISCSSINCTITFFDQMGYERRLTMVPSALGYWNIIDSHLGRDSGLRFVENYHLKHVNGDSAARKLTFKHENLIRSVREGNEHDFYLGYSYGPRAPHHELLTLELHDDNTATFEVYLLGAGPSINSVSEHTLTVSRGELNENHLVLRSEDDTRLLLSLFNNDDVLLEGFFLVGEPQIPGKSADKAVYFMKITPLN